VKLAGVIYFHRISEGRWRKSDTRSFEWLKRICGETTLRNVVLMTNMWGPGTPEEVGEMRERQLAVEFVKPALDGGAQLLRHYDTTESAHQIIRAILDNHRIPLQVQRELVDEKREFDRTTVGEGIAQEVEESTKKLEKKIERLEKELRTVADREKGTRSRQEAEITRLQEEIKNLTDRSRNMNTFYERRKIAAGMLFGFLCSPAGLRVSWMILRALCYYFLG